MKRYLSILGLVYGVMGVLLFFWNHLATQRVVLEQEIAWQRDQQIKMRTLVQITQENKEIYQKFKASLFNQVISQRKQLENLKDASPLIEKEDTWKDYQRRRVSINFTSTTDGEIFDKIRMIQRKLGGHVAVEKLIIQRTKEITPESLQLISRGKQVTFFNVNISLTWVFRSGT